MEEAPKNYVLAQADESDFYIPDALHVERNDDLMLCDDDEAASKIAEQDGVKLIYGMEHVPDGVYVDTPENRDVIVKQLIKYPEYKDVPIHGRILDDNEAFPNLGINFGRE